MEHILRLNGSNLNLKHLLLFMDNSIERFEIEDNLLSCKDAQLFKLNAIFLRSLEDDCSGLTSLLRAYSGASGEIVPKEVSMVCLALLLNENVKHRGEIRPEYITRIMSFINNGIFPAFHGSGSNEISAMCEIALALCGEKSANVYFNGTLCPVKEALRKCGLEETFTISLEEAAFTTNLCLASTAIAVCGYKKAVNLVKTADLCLSITLESIRGETGAFDWRLHELGRPYKNQIKSAHNVVRIIEGSEFTTEEGRLAFGYDKKARVQDAISFRAAPQTHGGVRDAVEWLGTLLEQEITSMSYKINPALGYGLDLVVIALADLGNISERRSFRLTDTSLSYGLPMNLVGGDPGYNHGFPVVQASSTAVLAELKLLAVPSSSNSVICTGHSKYHCTTYASALKLLEANSLLSKVFAIEMLMGAQAVDLAKDKLDRFRLGYGTLSAMNEFRKTVKVTRKDRFVRPDMVEAARLIDEDIVLKAVEKTIGELE